MRTILLIVAVVLFLIGLVLVFYDGGPKDLDGFLFGGLAAFAASFLPLPDKR